MFCSYLVSNKDKISPHAVSRVEPIIVLCCTLTYCVVSVFKETSEN